MAKEIKLPCGKVTVVDDDVFARVGHYKWKLQNCNGAWYVVRGANHPLHHEAIGKPPRRMVTDHIDGDTLNNTRANLRHCTQQRNMQNRKGRLARLGIPKGIAKCRDGKFAARFKVGHKNLYLGRFSSPTRAGIAYDLKAIEVCGEFARLNYPAFSPLAYWLKVHGPPRATYFRLAS